MDLACEVRRCPMSWTIIVIKSAMSLINNHVIRYIDLPCSLIFSSAVCWSLDSLGRRGSSLTQHLWSQSCMDCVCAYSSVMLVLNHCSTSYLRTMICRGHSSTLNIPRPWLWGNDQALLFKDYRKADDYSCLDFVDGNSWSRNISLLSILRDLSKQSFWLNWNKTLRADGLRACQVLEVSADADIYEAQTG